MANEGQGALEADVSVFGPIDPGARWPLGRTEAKVRVERFSTAMVDGVAGLSGDWGDDSPRCGSRAAGC